MIERRRYRVTGRVQGVGFRAFVRRAAQTCLVTGWVRNCADGAVESEAQGEAPAMAAFERRLREGPSRSRVTEVESEVRPPVLDEVGFSVMG